mmetsp:Transcript_133425/g.249458  ORF Transcript_133425/g.249458 Transcript_133425/m.249458 type:complete len:212 (+) Transcript_133425:178-813(+)
MHLRGLDDPEAELAYKSRTRRQPRRALQMLNFKAYTKITGAIVIAASRPINHANAPTALQRILHELHLHGRLQFRLCPAVRQAQRLEAAGERQDGYAGAGAWAACAVCLLTPCFVGFSLAGAQLFLQLLLSVRQRAREAIRNDAANEDIHCLNACNGSSADGAQAPIAQGLLQARAAEGVATRHGDRIEKQLHADAALELRRYVFIILGIC